jgi:hypothetical protein
MDLSRLLLLLLPCMCYSQPQGGRENKTLGINLRIPTLCYTTEGERCMFPFVFKGQRYTKCTYTKSPTPWCATMVDENDNAITNRWDIFNFLN